MDAVDGFGGWSVPLEAALTTLESPGKEGNYSEGAGGSTMMATENAVG